MKKVLLGLTVSLILTAQSRAQAVFTDTITFEKNSQLVKIDNSQPNNIWQIGKPQKVFFDSAYSKPKAIVTDTINVYPTNNLSSFQLVMKPPSLWTWGAIAPILEFQHKFDTDTLIDGGYIEMSYDGGTTWTNIANSLGVGIWGMSTPTDTLAGGILGFSGKSPSQSFNSGWTFTDIYFHGLCYVDNPPFIPDSVIVRFNFISDNIQTNKDGWMIDNIFLGNYGCPIAVPEIVSDNDFTISPNPFSTQTVLRTDNSLNNATITVDNCFGQTVAQIKNINGQTIVFNRDNLASGLYFVRLTQNGNTISADKFVITDK